MNASHDRNVSGLSIVSFDVETTGLKPEFDKIVEMGAVKFRGTSVIAEYSSFVNPCMPIPADVSRIHGITDGMVSDAAVFADRVDSLLDFFEDSIIVAHNASFDWGFLAAEMLAAGRKVPEGYRVFDTRLLAKRAFPNLGHYGLEFLSDRLSIEKGKSHRALDDARTCMRLFTRCVDELSFMGQFTLEELESFSIQTLSSTSNM